MGSTRRALAIVMLLAGAAGAEPRPVAVADDVHADPGFAWHAPDACPDAASVRVRAEQRFGGALDGNLHGIEIDIAREGRGFVARIDARAITVANDVRTLRSRRCDALADAVAVVLARLASEVRMSRNNAASNAPIDSVAMMPPAPPPTTAALSDDDIEGDMASQHIVDDEPAPKRPSKWGVAVHLLALSGVGALPQINIGGEVAASVRREEKFASLGISRWVPQSARLAPGAPGGVEVRLDTLTLRGGWGPAALPLRAWMLAEIGSIQGTGKYVDAERTASARWMALGAGLGVGWPMSDHARLVGTFEIAVPLQRPRFMLEAGADLYQPGAAAARCALGLEVGWP